MFLQNPSKRRLQLPFDFPLKPPKKIPSLKQGQAQPQLNSPPNTTRKNKRREAAFKQPRYLYTHFKILESHFACKNRRPHGVPAFKKRFPPYPLFSVAEANAGSRHRTDRFDRLDPVEACHEANHLQTAEIKIFVVPRVLPQHAVLLGGHSRYPKHMRVVFACRF